MSKEDENLNQDQDQNQDQNQSVAATGTATAPTLQLPDSREQVELVRELQDLEKSIENIGQEMTKPTDLLGIPVHITDAYLTEITDNGRPKNVVVFSLIDANTGENYSIMQSATGARNKLAEFFGKFRALGMPRTLEWYQLVEAKKVSAGGNRAIIFERAPKQV